MPAEKFIELYKNADESTIIHETAHWWLVLEAATGYKRQFLANPKNWEKVQDAIDKADDKISVDGGINLRVAANSYKLVLIG